MTDFQHLLHGAAGRWAWEPITIALLAASGLLYASGVRALWRRAGTGSGIKRWQAASFGAGLLALTIGLLSPLAWLSTVLFSAHMTQHEVLMLVAAPLLVFGHPLVAVIWALPRRWRDTVGGATRHPAFSNAWQRATTPLTVFIIHAIVLWLWHVPALWEAAMRSTPLHAIQHLTFVLAAALFWWGMVHGRYGRMAYGAAVFYVFLTAIHSSLLGAVMTIAPSIWYRSYVDAAAKWNVDALVDQQLAGLLMWVPSGVIFIVLGLALFAAWLGESERRVRLGSVQ